MNLKRTALRNIIIKLSKGKERILKETRENQFVTYKGASVRLPADFSTENLQTRENGMIYSKC